MLDEYEPSADYCELHQNVQINMNLAFRIRLSFVKFGGHEFR